MRPIIARSLVAMANPANTPHDVFRTMFTELGAAHEAEPELTRALAEEVVHLPATEDHYTEHVAAILRSRPDVRDGGHTAMGHVLVQTCETLTRWCVHDAPPDLDRTAFVDETVRMLTRFVR